MFWLYGTIFGLSWASGATAPSLRGDEPAVGAFGRSGPRKRLRWAQIVVEDRERNDRLGYDEDAGQAGGWAAGLHLRDGARGAPGAYHEAWLGALPGWAAGRALPRPRLSRARLLRAGRRLDVVGGSGVEGGGRRRVRHRPRRGGRGRRRQRPRRGRWLGRLLPTRGPWAPDTRSLPLLVRPPPALPLRPGRSGRRPAPEGAPRGAALVDRALVGPGTRAPPEARRLPGGGPGAPDAPAGERGAAGGRRRGRSKAQGRAPARR